VNEWQPIETAPRDGTLVVLPPPNDGEDDHPGFIARWRSGQWWMLGAPDPRLTGHDTPTHWRPLIRDPNDEEMAWAKDAARRLGL
jgi:hypothetical protein